MRRLCRSAAPILPGRRSTHHSRPTRSPAQRADKQLVARAVFQLDSNVVVAGVSDGGAHVKFLTAGMYPTDLLTWLVRDEKTVSLEDAHYQLSYLAAHLGGFKDLGAIREQAPADIIVYDFAKLEVLPR